MLGDWYAGYVLKRIGINNIRNKEVFNLQDAKRIAILFDGTKVKDIELIKRFVAKFAKGKEMVTVLGYVNSNRKSFDHISVLHFDYFSNGELSWFGKPKGVVIRNFLREEYDILVDLSLKVHYPLTYLAMASLARYKVGRFRKDISIFDLKIDNKEDRSLEALIKQFTHHLIPREGYESRIRKNGSCIDNPV